MLVSVVIPCFDANKTIEDTLNSVFQSTFKDFEVILINVAGTLDEAILERWKTEKCSGKLRVYRTKTVKGPAENRNFAIKVAKGKYIAFLDADDLWAEDKLYRQLKVMNNCTIKGRHPSICFTGRKLIDENGNDLNHYIGCDKIIRYQNLLKTNQINCSSVILLREDALKHKFPDGNFHEDYVVWLSVLKENPHNYAVGIDEPLLIYRMQNNSRSGHKLKSALMTERVYRYMKIPFFVRIVCMITYLCAGVLKYSGSKNIIL